MTDTDNASIRINQLRNQLDEHNHRYYVLDEPSVPDAEYDCKHWRRRILSW